MSGDDRWRDALTPRDDEDVTLYEVPPLGIRRLAVGVAVAVVVAAGGLATFGIAGLILGAFLGSIAALVIFGSGR